MDYFDKALCEYGVKEIPGKVDNPDILKYFNELGFDGSEFHDETAWCSAFVNWACKTTGFPYSGKLFARSWLGIGEPSNTPVLGDLVIFWRQSKRSWKGHVGFFVREDQNNIYVLGGNQNNQVNISKYPAYRLLGYRRINKIRDNE